MRKYLKPAGAIMLAIITAGSYVYPIPLPPDILQKWGFLIFFAIFCIYMVWYVHSQNEEIKGLKNEKPSISVVACNVNDESYIEVTNNGEKGIFEAEAYIVRDKGSHIAEKYYPIWRKTNENKSKILHGHSDTIKIASIRFTQTENIFELHAYSVANKTVGTVRSIEYTQLIAKGTKPNFIIQINISSDPSLKEKAFIGAYDVSLGYIYPTKVQSKLVSIPAEFTETIKHSY